MDVEEFLKKDTAATPDNLNEDFTDNENFDAEEFDPEGFEISDGDPYK